MIDWPDDTIDLRSDTVTLPTQAMRDAMLEARLGDDVLGDDPTVQELEALAARTLGKPAALFVPSGTMGNGAAVLTHTRRHGEVILERDAHIYNYESGAFSIVSGVSVRPIETRDGVITPEGIQAVLPPKVVHHPQPTLLTIENTHNFHSGAYWTRSQIDAACDAAHGFGLPVHCDGARIFNAATATGTPAKDLVRQVDSVMFCVSKGLSAPVGSLLVGSQEFIERARWARKMLGGGMRQAGILAACGIVAIREMTGRLDQDHRHAQRLAEGLSGIQGIDVDPARCPTNIVIFDVAGTGSTPQELCNELAGKGIRISPRGRTTIRGVTHRHVTPEDVDRAIEAIAQATKQG